jgi:undecaprenyl-diphosphatase
MSRVVTWLQYRELAVFRYANSKQHVWLDLFLNSITHLGGATATLIFTLCLSIFAPEPWNAIAMQSFVALSLSHLPVAVIKRKYPRLRPYLVLPQTNICKKPLTDHSFPSGHTTAIFSVAIPFMASVPVLSFLLLPLAGAVAWSRIYLGLHYPSDCAAGAFLGSMAALLAISVI